MPIYVQQSKSLVCPNNIVQPLSFTYPVASGSLIVCVISIGTTGLQLSSVNDNLNTGNYSTAVYKVGLPPGNVYVTYFPNSAPGSMTVSMTLTQYTAASEMWIYEVLNAALTSPIDAAGVANSGSNTSVNSSNMTTTASDILFGVTCVQNSITSGESGWFTTINSSGNAAEWVTKSSPGIYHASFTQNVTGLWVAALASFKQTSVVSLVLYGTCNVQTQSTGTLTSIKMLSGECDAQSINSVPTLILATVPMDGECLCLSVNLGDMTSGQPLAGICQAVCASYGFVESRIEYATVDSTGTIVYGAGFYDTSEYVSAQLNFRLGQKLYLVVNTPQPVFDPMTQYVLQRGWIIGEGIVSPNWVVFAQTPEQLVVTNAQAFYDSVMALGVVDYFTASDLVWNQNTSLSQLTVGTGIHLSGICTAHAANTPTLNKDLVMRRLMESVNAILQCKFQQQH